MLKKRSSKFNDQEATGWLSRPSGKVSDLSGDVEGLVNFIAAIDSTGLKFNRSHLQRTSVDNKDVFAIWNYVDLFVPEEKFDDLMSILMSYLKSSKKEDVLKVYTGE